MWENQRKFTMIFWNLQLYIKFLNKKFDFNLNLFLSNSTINIGPYYIKIQVLSNYFFVTFFRIFYL